MEQKPTKHGKGPKSRLGKILVSLLITAVVGLFEEPRERAYVACDECLSRDFCKIRPTGSTCRDLTGATG